MKGPTHELSPLPTLSTNRLSVPSIPLSSAPSPPSTAMLPSPPSFSPPAKDTTSTATLFFLSFLPSLMRSFS
jgi:hypothetical protein